MTSDVRHHLFEIARLAKGTIASDALETGGKLAPARLKPRKKPKVEKDEKADEPLNKTSSEQNADERLFVPISKADQEEQTVSGVVLQPEVTDAQSDIMDASVIRAAAFSFLSNYNKSTKLGLQHKEFKKGRFALVESYVAPMDFVLGTKIVKAGSWIMTVKVLDSKIWALVKTGKITGFSIGGRAKVTPAA